MEHKYATVDDTVSDVLPEIKSEGQKTTLGRILEGVSDLIDRYTDRPAAYFMPIAAEAEPTVKRFRGEGKNYLRIGRTVPDSVSVTNVADTLYYVADNGWLFAVDEVAQAGGPYDHGRISPTVLFSKGALYSVSAKWGFAETPAGIVLATKQIAEHIWDRGQGVFGQITPGGFVIERDIPLTAATILNVFKRREFELN